MLKKILLSLCLLLTVASLHAQTAAQFFLTMPDSLCPALDTRQRYTLIEYARAGATDSIENLFYGKSRITRLTDQHLTLQLANDIHYDILLQQQDSLHILFIQTACAPICASIAQRYNTNWQYLSTLYIPHEGDLTEIQVQDDLTLQYIPHTEDLTPAYNIKH